MTPKYYLNKNNEFVIENYNLAKPFANFFPGIAGKYGIPMWVFYVNRGQAISCFGTRDKDHAILEFFPANKAWQLTSLRGFRTFIKIARNKKLLFYEPFHNGPVNRGFHLTNQMCISSYDLKLKEKNLSLGLEIETEYFTIPNDSYSALVRRVSLKNISKSTQKIQLLDGLPQIIPFGTNNVFLKKMGRTIEAWMRTENMEKGAPFYKLAVDPSDRPEVIHIDEGNFYLGVIEDGSKPKVVKPIVDPECIFGEVSDFSYPVRFIDVNNFKYPQEQALCSKTPCGFILLDCTITSGQTKTVSSLIGYMRNKEILNRSLAKITSHGYLDVKQQENKNLIEQLQQDIETKSSSREFDLYAKQTYLDNIMRGGYPVQLSQNTVFYLYSRKHGDMERDYNRFHLQPTYYSQGNGNYRDVNQNRRCDVWFNPQVKDEDIITFFNLLQTDGFNPLVVKGVTFTLNDIEVFSSKLKELTEPRNIGAILSYLEKPTTPGDTVIFLEGNNIKLKVPYDDFIRVLLSYSTRHQESEHGEGFWIDHWTYNLDLLENYLAVYPDKLKELLFEKRIFTFYDNTEIIKPRSEKYLLKDGLVRQLHSVGADAAKREMIHKRHTLPHLVRVDYGKGEIYYTTLVNKLVCLLVNKISSLDAFGCGVEMEANKPNWFDALNGLPALLGSSLCETFEVKRLLIFIRDALRKCRIEQIVLSEEVYHFLINLVVLLKEWRKNNSSDRDYLYWDKSSSLKEVFRQGTRLGLSGKELDIPFQDLNIILEDALAKVEYGIKKAKDHKDNVYYGYFINEVAEYESVNLPFVRPVKFIQKKLPLFLEAQMHALRLSENQQQAKAVYKATRQSPLYDKQLKMYKVTASLKNMPEEIGRCRVFTPGWLENESIWLHMEYKYLLEVLKHGLCDEFYDEFKKTLIPFQDPKRYGRSILENSSFLVSSAFPDKHLHGMGFVARLSGSTAEFLNIWLVMNIGRNPFYLNAKNELELIFKPCLKGWLFNQAGLYTFNFLSQIQVVYHNPKRKDTFGVGGVKPQRIVFKDKNSKPVEITSDTIPSSYAHQIRLCQIKKIEVYFGGS